MRKDTLCEFRDFISPIIIGYKDVEGWFFLSCFYTLLDRVLIQLTKYYSSYGWICFWHGEIKFRKYVNLFLDFWFSIAL